MAENILYKSETRTLTYEEEECQYYMTVEKGGDHSTDALPHVVWQIDLDAKGKPWNATPCVAKPTLKECIDWIQENI